MRKLILYIFSLNIFYYLPNRKHLRIKLLQKYSHGA